ncbi:MAG TPA: hypothetical protein VFE45_09140, partial [Coriobacteriia bacterium]|nr:hypothetical protein [Coriobacteriia bacterium]
EAAGGRADEAARIAEAVRRPGPTVEAAISEHIDLLTGIGADTRSDHRGQLRAHIAPVIGALPQRTAHERRVISVAWSRKRVIVAGLTTGAAVFAIAVLFNGGLTPACPAVGYADISPIKLRFDPSADVDSVAACFGRGCQPVVVARNDDSEWAVPQDDMYLQGASLGSVNEVTVVASSDGVALVNDVFEIGQERAGGGGVLRQCPGPMRYVPVQVSASSL